MQEPTWVHVSTVAYSCYRPDNRHRCYKYYKSHNHYRTVTDSTTLTLLTTPTMLTKLTIATISLQFPSGGSKKQCVLGHAVHDVRTVRVVSTVRHCVCMIVGTVSVVCAAISVPQRPTASHKAIQRPSTPYSALQRHKSKALNNLNLKLQTNPSIEDRVHGIWNSPCHRPSLHQDSGMKESFAK